MSEPVEKPVILIVEDDLDIRDFISAGLVNDFEIVEAGHGQSGLKKALELIPDLIVSDIMMPGMNGIELCRALKSKPETSHVPIILLTAKTAVEDQLDGLCSGADDYVTKPFNLILLKARIENLLKMRRMLREKFKQEYVPGEQPQFLQNEGDRSFLEKALRVLSEHYADWDFDDGKFANEMGMGLRSLQRKLKAVSDQSPYVFLNEFRMKRAAELLATSSKNITEIAFSVGIEEPTSFSRLFKKHYGISPSDYRRTYSSSD